MADLEQRIAAVKQRMVEAAASAGRDARNIQLLAVSKTRKADEIREAVGNGLTEFGENYLQEALPKIAALRETGVSWHFIGPVQSNKTRDLATHFDWVQTVDRIKIARRLSEQRNHWAAPLNVCVQVNISREPQKAGVAPEQAAELCRQITGLPRLRLRGLMVIPEATGNLEKQKLNFTAAHDLYQALRSQGLPLDTLSMGMSADLEAGIAAGSTMVRIGSDIFGPRQVLTPPASPAT